MAPQAIKHQETPAEWAGGVFWRTTKATLGPTGSTTRTDGHIAQRIDKSELL